MFLGVAIHTIAFAVTQDVNQLRVNVDWYYMMGFQKIPVQFSAILADPASTNLDV